MLRARANLAYLARRVAEAQVDLMRVRRARHAILTRALDNPRYRSPRYLRRQIAMLVAVGELLVRGIAVPDAMRKAAFGRPRGAPKFALVIADLAHELARFERYERRALSRRKAAVAAFDAACAGQGSALIELPATAAPLLPPSPLRAGRSHMAAAFTSPRMRGEVERAERARVRGRFRESEPVETPPHPDPLHSPSKTGVNALKASGEREQKRRDTCDHPAHKGEGEEAPNKEARSWRNKATASGAPASSILRAAQRIPSPQPKPRIRGFRPLN